MIFLALHMTVGTRGHVPAVFSIKASLSQDMCSKWTQSTAQMSEPLQKVQKLRVRFHLVSERCEWAECLVGPVQMGVMREQLWCAESREHRGEDLCIRSPALSGSYSLPLLTDAVCFTLCLALPQKTNVGNHCVFSPTSLFRFQHGWVTLW